MRRLKLLKTLYGTLAFLSLFMVFGTIGSAELGNIGPLQCLFEGLAYIALFAFFAFKTKVYYWQQKKE